MINHPSFNPHLAGCTEQDVSEAISRSLVLGGQSVGITYSETAARILSNTCDWESDDEYAYQGTADNDDREWRVHLVG
jgi:hypothetical protein